MSVRNDFDLNVMREAKQLGRELQNSLDLWYRRTFNLTVNDPRFLNTTRKERLTDYWAWQYADNPKLLDAVEDESFDLEAIQAEWAEDAGEAADIYTPHAQSKEIDPDEVDDWEDV